MTTQTELLDEWRAECAANVDEAKRLTNGLSDDQFNWHPAPDRWSIAQIIDHLNIVARLTLPRLEEAISLAPNTDSRKVWKPTFMERLFISMLGPNTKFKSPVPPPFVPGSGGQLANSMAEFEDLHRRLSACVDKSAGLDLKRIKATSAANKRVKMS